MKTIFKFIISGVIIIVIGVAILIAALALNGWTFSNDYEMSEFTADGQNNRLEVSMGAGTVVTEFYDGDVITISYPESSKFTAEITENNGLLKFQAKMKHVFFFGLNKIPQTVIRLPKDVTFDIDFEMSAGTAKLADGTYGNVELEMSAGVFNIGSIVCNNFECDMAAGTVNIDKVECNNLECDLSTGTLKVSEVLCNKLICEMSAGSVVLNNIECTATQVSMSLGSVSLNYSDKKELFNITTKVSAGSCNVSPQSGTTDKTININISAGSANLKFAD